MTGSTDPEREAAVRTVRLVGVAIVALAVGALVVALTTLLDDDESDRLGSEDPVIDVDDGDEVDPAEAVGPPDGERVAPYVADARRRLEAAEGERGAVVSLSSYLTASEAAELAADHEVEVRGLLVALPGGAPSAVEDDLDDWLASQAEAARAERDEIAKLLPTVTDAEFGAFYRSEITRFDAIIAAAEGDGPIVFGLAVVGRADRLRDLAEVDDVRVVDVGGGDDLDPAAARGIRPESTVVVGEPEFRPVR